MQAIRPIEAKRWWSAGDIPAATSEDVDAAVKAAKEAFHRNKGKDWAKATGAHRATYLRKIAKRVRVESRECVTYSGDVGQILSSG